MPGVLKWTRRLLFYPLCAAAGALAVDDKLNSQRVRRNMRALWTGCRILYEYKMRWDENSLNSDLHRRVATMILETCQKNGGLYIKFGQGIASMNHILPKQYNEVFQVLHDNAPYVSYENVRDIILQDLKVDPNLIFKSFDKIPIASASIAQVHKATLYNGETVAVKVQKPHIADQVPWDLTCYRILLHAFEYVFDLPLVWSANFTEKQMMKEVDFVIEAMNGQKTQQLLNNDKYIFDYPTYYYRKKRYKNYLQWKNLEKHATFQPKINNNNNIDNLQFDKSFDNNSTFKRNKYIKNTYLKNHVYVPKLYPQYCSKRILTAEWCDGVKVNNESKISSMGISFRDVMHSVVSLFGYQIFVTGVVHCDPHPGNVLVRKHPFIKNDYQLIFLDHGLYINEPNKFREEYSQFWTAMFIQDINKLNKIGEKWGINDIDFFASLQLIKPFSSKKGVISMTNEKLSKAKIAAMQIAAKERVTKVLKHTKSIPRHLIFVGRNMNIVRANNKDLGSPVNRVSILAEYAARGASLYDKNNNNIDYYWKFRLRMLGLNFYYNWKRIYSNFYKNVYGIKTKSFEDEIEEQMTKMAKEMGLVVDETMFDA